MVRARPILLSIFAFGFLMGAVADAQRPPREQGSIRIVRTKERGLSLFKSSSEEWSCARPQGELLVRFETVIAYPATTRIFLDGKEIDSTAVNSFLKTEVRERDLVRIDLVQCSVESVFLPMLFEIHQGSFPGEPTNPIGRFKISELGTVHLDKVF